MLAYCQTKKDENLGQGPAPSKPEIITLGGCNFMEAFSPLQDAVNHTHFWRATIPSIASKAISVNHTHWADKRVATFLDREATKVVYQRIKSAPNSTIMLEAAADFVINFLKIGNSILPDIRNDALGSEFRNITYEENSELANAEILSANSDYYWDLWKYYFHIMYEDLFKERLKRGIQVVFLSRRLCLSELKDGEFVSLQRVKEISKRNSILDDIERFVSQYKDITLIKTSQDLLYTSTNSPWGGPWEFHPTEGYYADLRSKFLDVLFPTRAKGEKYIASWIAEADRSLDAARSAHTALERELENVRAERGLLEHEINILRAQCTSLEAETQSRVGECEQLNNLLEEANKIAEQNRSMRDALGEELAARNDTIAVQGKAHELLNLAISNLEAQNAELNQLTTFIARRYKTGKLSLIDRFLRLFALLFEVRQLRRFGFDERKYLEANQDVGHAGMTGAKHYLLYGMREGRKLFGTFSIILCSMMMFDSFTPDMPWANARPSKATSSIGADLSEVEKR